MKFESKFCSSLAKIFPLSEPEVEIRSGCALRGERYAFQIAYKSDEYRFMEIQTESAFGDALRIRKVGLVPVEYCGTVCDDDVISMKPGLYPDVLSDVAENNPLPILPDWHAAWISIDVPENFKAGIYSIKFTFKALDMTVNPTKVCKILGTKTFRMEILNEVLPPQKLINTHWFYTDCIANYYHVEVFSEEYWRIVGNYMKSAAQHGINMLLTPVFTPPLDTKVGHERLTVQLVDVTCNKGKYTFDLSKLERWIVLAQKCGIQYFEISHLFTQWGAEFTPKIVARVNGKIKRIFGWDVKAQSKEYQDFLNAFLPVLVSFLKKKKLQNKTYFHCSDEPNEKHLENYKFCKNLLSRHLKGFKIMDAMSHLEFYKQGMVDIPVPIESSFEEFLADGMKERWTYYCCGPVTEYCNRFIHMPSSRNRIFGAMLYKYDIQGFLHWGFNFYNAGLSIHTLNPYTNVCGGYFYPGGDAFLLYPGENGVPEDSLRYEVFHEALQDQRVMDALEKYIGRETIVKELDKLSPNKELKMAQYPKGEKAVLAVRAKINQLFRKALTSK